MQQPQEQQPNTDDSDDAASEPKETDTIAPERMDRFTWEAGDIVFDEDEGEDEEGDDESEEDESGEEDTGERPVVKP